MFVVVDVAFSFGTSPKKHINGNPRMLVGFLPVALASAPRPPLFSSLGAKPKERGTSVDDGRYGSFSCNWALVREHGGCEGYVFLDIMIRYDRQYIYVIVYIYINII